MAERRMGIIAFLFCLCLCLMSCCGQAASTADAKEAISPEKECALTLSYRCNGTAFEAVPVNLYRIADVSANYQYSLTEPFAAAGLELNGIASTSEWNEIRSTLEAYILAHDVEAACTARTDAQGQARFEGLEPGLYLAVNGETENCRFDSALLALPGLGADGLWQYKLTAALKGEEIPPVEPDEEIELKLLKLWKGDDGQSDRPASIQAEIFRNGELYQTVTLSKENNWAYSWTAENDGASWNVTETDVPSGYVMTVEKRGTTFILTNTMPSDDPPGDDVPPEDSPKTGDSESALLYTVLMYVSGAVLVILGITGKRKRT